MTSSTTLTGTFFGATPDSIAKSIQLLLDTDKVYFSSGISREFVLLRYVPHLDYLLKEEMKIHPFSPEVSADELSVAYISIQTDVNTNRSIVTARNKEGLTYPVGATTMQHDGDTRIAVERLREKLIDYIT